MLLILSVVIVLLEAFDALIGICRDDVIHPGMPPHKQGLPLHHNNQQHSRALAFVGGVCMGTHTLWIGFGKVLSLLLVSHTSVHICTHTAYDCQGATREIVYKATHFRRVVLRDHEMLGSLVTLYHERPSEPHSLLLDRSTWNALMTRLPQPAGMLPVNRLLPNSKTCSAVPLAAHSALRVPDTTTSTQSKL